jgi:hypothetical protein
MSKHTLKHTSKFATAASAHAGQVEILSPGSCDQTRPSPSQSTRRSTMTKHMMSIAAVAVLVFALAPEAQAAWIAGSTP